MRDRDKLLVIIVLIAGVILLPYFFYIKDTKEATVNTQNETAGLNERLTYLRGLEDKREDYERETAEFNAGIVEIANKYPTGISNRNLVMFLENTEQEIGEIVLPPIIGIVAAKNAMAEEGDELLEVDEKVAALQGYYFPGVRFSAGSFGTPVEYPLENEDYTTEYSALTMTTEFSFVCREEDYVFLMLEYLNSYRDPFAYSSISFEFDDTTGNVEGECIFTEYAVLGGEGRAEFEPLPIYPDIDDLDLRGNQVFGIFGPNTRTREKAEFEAVKEAEKQAAEREEAEQ